ncbi:Tyrosine recombinase XerC [Methylophaga frappieri]|uniref:Tyrosine recombinase XerC n=1 Tax=Methylophaga frappieri (strain ATCC BAA-2434 / DSM 25690 / JAM7) TaxID=754477 RepID=I1YKC6_METFJ|nr:tyrosine recombinase XerC [Methylophaga frappieri]AFJ03369.1 Tyrosine recombinase XerC [Methylophaga frappieri]
MDKQPDLNAPLQQFLDHLAQHRRLSQHTVTSYQRDCQQLSRWCQQQKITHWQRLKPVELRQFVSGLHRQGLSARTIHRLLSAVRSFYRYLIQISLVDHNPAQSVQAPKTEKRLPKTFDVDQVSALLDLTPDTTFVACRDRAIMELFYSSGLRLAELAALDLQDVDFAEQQLWVHEGKGGKDRILPMGSKAIAALKNWLDKREQQRLITSTALFITQQGRRLGVRSIQQRLAYWGKKHGLSQHVHPHRLRHAFASHMLESSGDLRAVQELLGHADISTTQIYTHVDFNHLAKVYDSAHPRAKKRDRS